MSGGGDEATRSREETFGFSLILKLETKFGYSKTIRFTGLHTEGDIFKKAKLFLLGKNISFTPFYKKIKTFEVQNTILFDLNSDQQNIIQTTIYKKKRSFLLTTDNVKGMLNE
jgi:hypothetical protein